MNPNTSGATIPATMPPKMIIDEAAPTTEEGRARRGSAKHGMKAKEAAADPRVTRTTNKAVLETKGIETSITMHASMDRHHDDTTVASQPIGDSPADDGGHGGHHGSRNQKEACTREGDSTFVMEVGRNPRRHPPDHEVVSEEHQGEEPHRAGAKYGAHVVPGGIRTVVVLRRKCRREPQLDADEREYAERRDGQKHSTPADQREKCCRNNDGKKRTDGVGTVHPSCGSGTLLRDAPLGNELYCSCRKHSLRETEEKANNQKRPRTTRQGQ